MVIAGRSAGILPAPENAARMAALRRWGHQHILQESIRLLAHSFWPASFLRALCALRGEFVYLELRPAVALHYPMTAPLIALASAATPLLESAPRNSFAGAMMTCPTCQHPNSHDVDSCPRGVAQHAPVAAAGFYPAGGVPPNRCCSADLEVSIGRPNAVRPYHGCEGAWPER